MTLNEREKLTQSNEFMQNHGNLGTTVHPHLKQMWTILTLSVKCENGNEQNMRENKT